MKLSDLARITGPLALTEGEAPDGSRWGVVIIQAGISKNRNRYQRSVLEAAAGKYEGAHVYWDHSEGPRSARDLAGFISDVGMTEEDGTFALTGTLNVTNTDLRDGLREAARLGKPDLYGLSHDARARTAIVQDPGVGAVRDVLEIEDVLSVDVVSRPAAGGRVVRIAAGEGAVSADSEKEIIMFERLLAQYKALRPNATIKEGITEDELLDLITEALKQAPASSDATPPARTQEQAPPVVHGLSEEDRTMLRESLLDRAFAGRTLPEAVGAKLRESLSLANRPTLSLAEAQSVIDGWVETLAPLSDQVRGSGSGSTIQTTEDEADKKLKALDGFFAQEDVDGQARYTSFKEAYIDITGDRNVTGDLREAVGMRRFERLASVRESMTTASWGEILGDSIRRQMLRDYREPDQWTQWRQIVSDITSPSDFRTNRRLRLAGYGDLTTVGESQPYPSVVSPGDEEATYSVSKKGGIESITQEMILNDDVGAIRRIPTNLGMAAKRTLAKSVFNLIRDNGTIYDGKALAHNDHGNLGTTALSGSAQITAARLAMAEQTAYGNADNVLDITPKILVVPAELEEIGWRLTSIPMTDQSGRNATEPNYVRNRLGLNTLIVLPYWTDATNWWVIADPRSIPTIEVGFLQGRQEPQLYVADNPTSGSLFTADKIDYKIKFVWGVAVLEYRGFYGGIVAG